MRLQAAPGAAARDSQRDVRADAAGRSCPGEGTLLELAQGAIGGPESESLWLHLDGCAPCREIVAALARDATPATGSAPREPRPGDSIDRFLLLEELGRGGMGIVYAAFDPMLDRKVARKLLRADAALPAGAAAARLLIEAQALARLAHPNVVTVFEAKAHGAQVYLAMELIEGESLRDFAARRPDARELLARFCEAGRGLAAAHERGLIHRDFKPDNALLGGDGRVCVTDFGLAQRRAQPGPQATRAAPAGTPGYLAPELWLGRAADARSDQFSFCVSLWEALFGARPFAADPGPRLLEEVRRGPLAQGGLRLRPSIPLRVRRALHQGLRFEPGERHASMRALLSELEAELQPGARSTLTQLGMAAAALALIGSGALAHALWIGARSPSGSAAPAPGAAELRVAPRGPELAELCDAPIAASFASAHRQSAPALAEPTAQAPGAGDASPAPGPLAIAAHARPRARRAAPAAIPPAPLAGLSREASRDAGTPSLGPGRGGGGSGSSNGRSTLAPPGDPLGARTLR